MKPCPACGSENCVSAIVAHNTLCPLCSSQPCACDGNICTKCRAAPCVCPPPVEQSPLAAQGAPARNDQPSVWDLVMTDMQTRDQEGRRKYGTPLQPHNGRDALADCYQELLDAVCYMRQAIFERDGR